MLVNPELGNMTEQDLNRRYSNSYVKYGDKIVWVVEFPTRTRIAIATGNEVRIEKFNWALLDVERPRPKWVQYKKEFFFVSYLMERQFTRGFNYNSTSIWCPNGNHLDIPGPKAPDVFDLFYKKQPYKRLSVKQIRDELKTSTGVLLSPQLLVYGPPGMIMFRDQFLGELGKIGDLFLPEVKELIEDIDENRV